MAPASKIDSGLDCISLVCNCYVIECSMEAYMLRKLRKQQSTEKESEMLDKTI